MGRNEALLLSGSRVFEGMDVMSLDVSLRRSGTNAGPDSPKRFDGGGGTKRSLRFLHVPAGAGRNADVIRVWSFYISGSGGSDHVRRRDLKAERFEQCGVLLSLFAQKSRKVEAGRAFGIQPPLG